MLQPRHWEEEQKPPRRLLMLLAVQEGTQEKTTSQEQDDASLQREGVSHYAKAAEQPDKNINVLRKRLFTEETI